MATLSTPENRISYPKNNNFIKSTKPSLLWLSMLCSILFARRVNVRTRFIAYYYRNIDWEKSTSPNEETIKNNESILLGNPVAFSWLLQFAVFIGFIFIEYWQIKKLKQIIIVFNLFALKFNTFNKICFICEYFIGTYKQIHYHLRRFFFGFNDFFKLV